MVAMHALSTGSVTGLTASKATMFICGLHHLSRALLNYYSLSASETASM